MCPCRLPNAFEGFYHSVSKCEKGAIEKIWNTIHVPEERCWGAPSLSVIERSRKHHDCCDTPSEDIPALNGFHDLPGVLFLCLDHSFTLMGLRYRLYKQQTPQNSSASPRSRNPQTTRIKVHRPKKHCKRKRKHGEMRKPTEHTRDVKIQWEMCCYLWQSSITEFPNATEAARGSNYMFVFFPLFPLRQITCPLSSSRAGSCSAIQTTQTVWRI